MADFVQNDTASILAVVCSNKATKAALNLSGSTVRLKWKYQGALQIRVMTITDAAAGKAEYKFAAGELQPSVKEAEVEVTLPTAEVITSTSRIKLDIAKEMV